MEQLNQGQAPDFPAERETAQNPTHKKQTKKSSRYQSQARSASTRSGSGSDRASTTVGLWMEAWVPRYLRYPAIPRENDELGALRTCPQVGAGPSFPPATGLQSRSVSVRSFKAGRRVMAQMRHQSGCPWPTVHHCATRAPERQRPSVGRRSGPPLPNQSERSISLQSSSELSTKPLARAVTLRAHVAKDT